MDPRTASLCAIFVLFVVAIWQRRILFSVSGIAIFFATNVLIILFGVLSYPFVGNPLPYSGIDFALFSDAGIVRAIWLNAGGMLLILAGYHLSHMLFTGRVLRSAPNLLASVPNPRVGFSVSRAVILSGAVFLYLLWFFAKHQATLSAGISQGLMVGANDFVIATRRLIGQDYLSILVILNIAPFVSVALWLAARIRRNVLLGMTAFTFCAVTGSALMLTFQKRPLLVYLLTLFSAEVWMRLSRSEEQGTLRRVLKGLKRRVKRSRVRKFLPVVFGLLIVFGALLGLYYMHASFAREGGLASMLYLGQVAVSGTAYGLAVPAIMQAEYFPAVEGYYGVSNLRIVSRLTGQPLYGNTVVLYSYFFLYKEQIGSVAVPAVMDFYGAFGMIGWFLGCLLMGTLLERADTLIGRSRRSAATTLLASFLFVFAFYLSHASVANSLMGYGGGFFLALWLLLTVRLGIRLRRSRTRPMIPASNKA